MPDPGVLVTVEAVIRALAVLLTGALVACTTPPPVAVPSTSTAVSAATASPAHALAPTCFAPPSPTYLPWAAARATERITNEKGVEYVRYLGPTIAGSSSAYFAIARAPADRLFPVPAVAARDVSGRQVVIHRIGDPGVGEVGARWQEGMDGCTYDAHLLLPSAGAADETEIAKIVASLDVWAAARSQLPADIAVLKPTFLPARFSDPPWLLSLFNDSFGPRYYIGYGAKGESLIFYLGSANSAQPTSTEPITIRGVNGTLGTTASWPAIQAIWMENGRPYIIQDSSAMTRDELLKIVAGLVEVR
jgi:hypothetical protein